MRPVETTDMSSTKTSFSDCKFRDSLVTFEKDEQKTAQCILFISLLRY